MNFRKCMFNKELKAKILEYRKKKYWKKLGLCLGIGLWMFLNTQIANAKICAEDELVGIAANTNAFIKDYISRCEYYDCDGNYIGLLNKNIGNYEIEKVKRNTLTVLEENHHYVVYEYDSPIRKVAEHDAKECEIILGKKGYLLLDYQNGEIQLYANTGECIFSTAAYLNPVEENRMWQKYACIQCSDAGFYVSYLEEDAKHSQYINHVVRVTQTGMIKNEIAKSITKEAKTPELFVLGDYPVFERNVYDCTGKLLIEDVDFVYEPGYDRFDELKITGVLKKESSLNGKTNYVLYDKNLNIKGSIEESEELLTYLENPDYVRKWSYNGTVLRGEQTEYLNGETCQGFIPYCGPIFLIVIYMKENVEGWVPYANVDDGIIIYLNGQSRFLALDEDESIITVNDYLYLTSKGDYSVLRCMDTGEILGEYHGFCFLEKNILIVGEYDGGWKKYHDFNVVEINPDTYEITTRMIPGYIYPWTDNCIGGYRSIYQGIMDKEGNWIVKMIRGNE